MKSWEKNKVRYNWDSLQQDKKICFFVLRASLLGNGGWSSTALFVLLLCFIIIPLGLSSLRVPLLKITERQSSVKQKNETNTTSFLFPWFKIQPITRYLYNCVLQRKSPNSHKTLIANTLITTRMTIQWIQKKWSMEKTVVIQIRLQIKWFNSVNFQFQITLKKCLRLIRHNLCVTLSNNECKEYN